MSQLYLPLDDVLVQPTSTTAKPVPLGTNGNAAARKCHAAADALEKHTTAKHDSANCIACATADAKETARS